MALQSLTVGGARFRTGRWRGRADLAYLVPVSPAHTLASEVLSEARRCLEDRGYTEVVTAAVPPPERDAFLRDDFVDHERLHLLRHDLTRLPKPTKWPFGRHRGEAPRIERGHRSDWPAVLEVDGRAFDEFWRLDADGLDDALRATPHHRLRVVRDVPRRTGDVHAYAAAGRAGPQGYIQRLAVDPDHEGAGLGTALVHDAMRWMRRRGADVAWVNTQERNERALTLYRHLGFQLEPHQLTVLRRPVA